MDPVAIGVAVAAALMAAGVLLYVVASGVAHRHKWATAVKTSQRLRRSGDLQAVERAVASEEEGERLGAVLAIGEDDSPNAERILCDALKDEATEVRRAATVYLSRHKRPPAVAALRAAAAADGDPLVRLAAVRSLGLIGDSAAVPELAAVLQDGLSAGGLRGRGQRACAAAAAEALGRINDAKAIAALAAAQAAGRGEIRRAAEAGLRLQQLAAEARRADADADTLKRLAVIHLMSRDDDEASGWLKRAAERPDADAEVFHLLGLLYQRQERWGEAETCYRRAIELDPVEPFPYFGLGVIYRSRNQTAKALSSLRKYVELAPAGERARAAARMIRELEGRT
ncbi:MAG: tetratricopeptide repeat protein [Armatimonadota bacterium]